MKEELLLHCSRTCLKVTVKILSVASALGVFCLYCVSAWAQTNSSATPGSPEQISFAPTPLPTSTPRPSPTSTPRPTPTPAPMCSYVFTMTNSHDWGYGSLYRPPSIWSVPALFINNHMNRAYALCAGYNYWSYDGWVNSFDDCVAEYFGAIQVGRISKHLTPSYSSFSGVCLLAICSPPPGSYFKYYFTSDGTQISDIPAGSAVCDAGSFDFAVSPISLIIDESTDIDSNISLVPFPLDPSKPNRWYIWKASSKTPLLVYDPEHKGKITSSAQLFGNWTFGGKKLASLNSSSANTKWRDGYEALESLDANQDAKISGVELEPLGLWFDNNRDGVSQPGEVKSLNEVGILSLFYHVDRLEEATNNLFATKGYEREVDGKIQYGTSVDWYSDSAMTRQELLDAFFQSSAIDKMKAPVSSQTSAEIVSESEIISKKNMEQDTLSGLWVWQTEDRQFSDQEHSPQGYFTFSTQGGDKFKGHTYSQILIPTTTGNVSQLTATVFDGKKIKASNGRYNISYTVKTDSVTIENTALLNSSGTKLNGESLAHLTYKGKPISVRYSWTATRFKQGK